MTASVTTSRAGARVLRILCCVILPALLCACISPTARSDRLAAGAGYERGVVTGSAFRHVVYTPVDTPGRPGRLHVYLGGDGTPWVAGSRISTDPTPRNPLALRLMRADPAFSIFIGRPCYLGMAGDPACTGDVWTEGRYSRAVVASMAAAISGIVSAHRPHDVVLIGYSGGGTLAVLVAPELPEVAGVITIAGNLDVAAWSETHGYLPLTRSLDPSGRRTDDGRRVPFVHLVGSEDRNVPRKLTQDYAAGRRCHQVIVVEGHDHACCWEDQWPALLRRAEDRLGSACR